MLVTLALTALGVATVAAAGFGLGAAYCAATGPALRRGHQQRQRAHLGGMLGAAAIAAAGVALLASAALVALATPTSPRAAALQTWLPGALALCGVGCAPLAMLVAGHAQSQLPRYLRSRYGYR